MARRKKPRILIVNDDGLHGEGLRPLMDALAELGDITVLVPEKERSAESHSLTLHKPLRIRSHRDGIATVNGGPADCSRLGALQVLSGRVDLVVSGVNQGYNLGQDTIYSGTVAGAMEAALIGIPAFAISRGGGSRGDFRPAAEVAARVAREVLKRGLPPGVCLNVNVPPRPAGKLKKSKISRLGERIYENRITARRDPQGGAYYWLMGKLRRSINAPGTDVAAVHAGHVSVTPMGIDRTHTALLARMKGWTL